MKLLLKLVFNRLILTLLILLFFAIDFRFVSLNPFQYYSIEQPTVEASEYYEVKLGEAKVYVLVYLEDGSIHLKPSNELPEITLIKVSPVVEWYFYFGLLVLANIVPFGWFFPKKKKEKKK